MNRAWRHALALASGVLVVLAGLPASADAHGLVAPVASSYLAKVSRVPPGLEAKVVDGDQRMWLRVAPGDSVVVLDYVGAPYLRFSASGVEVNRNSAMYYLNQTPFAQTPPSNLDRSTAPRWQRVTGAHDYGWHDGRLHALATVALSPGVAYVGRWSIPLLINGRPSALLGGLWHAGDPSIVWFWPIAVVLLCVLAAWRVRRPALDLLVARVLAIAALIAIAAAALASDLHGRPSVSVFQLIELAVLLAFVAWGLGRVLLRRPGFFLCFVIAFVAVWEGAILIPTLVNGFVLIAGPAFVVRAATVVCLGTGAGLLLLVFRLAGQREGESSIEDQMGAVDGKHPGVSESLVWET
jgi:hypothetical protein